MKILALHGFLGRGSDWDFLREAGFDVVAPDDLRDRPAADIILGYSLGGRLALHAANDYDLAVIISAGITPGDAARKASDEAWARRFESDNWQTLMRDWNAQSVFGGHDLRRDEQPRAPLARALREWSPAVLMPPDLRTISTRVLWIAGERDAKYVDEGRRAVALLPNATLSIVEGAGHRVPFERPDAVVALLRDALRNR